MLGKTFLNGFFNDPLGGILDLIQNVLEYNILAPVRTLIGELFKLAYTLWSVAASLIDSIQVIFGMLVGTVSVYWQNGSGMGGMVDASGNQMTQGVKANNMVLDIFLSEYVLGAFWKILILSIFLLLIFTIIAIIKNEYSTAADGSSDPKKPETSNNKMFIIKRAVKSLMGFLCVPLACIFGIIASGYLMQALDAATSITGETMLSNKMFELCASDCNRVRTDNNFYIKLSGVNQSGTEDINEYDVTNGYEKFPDFKNKNPEDLADLIDDYFIYGKELPQETRFSEGDSFGNFSDATFAWIKGNGTGMNDDHYFNTKNPAQVYYYYDLVKFEWLIGIATIFWMLVLMIKLSLGAAVRLYELAILFIISPAIISISPLDGGEALKTWQKKFIGKTTMVFAPVLALNLYFILVATLMQVDFTESISIALTGGGAFFTGTTAAAIQQVYNIMIAIAGLMVCDNAMKWLGEIIGAEDMKEAGDKLQSRLASAVTTSAAGKYLLSKGAGVKGGLGGLASKGVGKLKDAVGGAIGKLDGDHRDADVTRSAQLQNEAQFQANQRNVNSERMAQGNDALSQDNHDTAQNTLNAAGYDNDTLEGLRDLAMNGLDDAKDKYGNDASLNDRQKFDKILDDVTKDMKFDSDEETQAFKDYMKQDLYGAMAEDMGKWQSDEDAKAQEEHEKEIKNMKNVIREKTNAEKQEILALGQQQYNEGKITQEVIKSVNSQINANISSEGRAGMVAVGKAMNLRSKVRRSKTYNSIKEIYKSSASQAKKDLLDSLNKKK